MKTLRIVSLGLATLTVAACVGDIGGGGPDEPGETTQALCAPPSARAWKLTPRQLEKTGQRLTGTPIEIATELERSLSISTRFRNHAAALSMSLPHVEKLFAAAEVLADALMAAPDRHASCMVTDAQDEGCVETYLGAVAQEAFRRPATEEEVTRYLDFYRAERGEDDAPTALRSTLRAMMMSPHFLYRMETGDFAKHDAEVALSPYELASAVAYLVTQGPPDEALLAAAADGTIQEPAVIERHVRRLLAADGDWEGVRTFMLTHFGVDAVADVNRNEELFPDFAAVQPRMVEESERFIAHVLLEDDGRLATLFTADYTFADEDLSAFYGLPAASGSGFGQVSLAGTERLPGLLGQGSFLAYQATFEEPDLVLRGKHVRKQILCGDIPPPPPELSTEFPPDDGTMTQRDRLAQHREDTACAACHSLMDPIGYAFGHFDAVGRYQDDENGLPIDDSGEVVGMADATFDEGAGLLEIIAGAESTHTCFARRASEYSLGVTVAHDDCALEPLTKRFVASEGDIIDLVVALATSPAFTTRSTDTLANP